MGEQNVPAPYPSILRSGALKQGHSAACDAACCVHVVQHHAVLHDGKTAFTKTPPTKTPPPCACSSMPMCAHINVTWVSRMFRRRIPASCAAVRSSKGILLHAMQHVVCMLCSIMRFCMMAKPLSQKLHRQKLHRRVHAVVGCKHLVERSGDCDLICPL
jgi:hypothetical protein